MKLPFWKRILCAPAIWIVVSPENKVTNFYESCEGARLEVEWRERNWESGYDTEISHSHIFFSDGKMDQIKE